MRFGKFFLPFIIIVWASVLASRVFGSNHESVEDQLKRSNEAVAAGNYAQAIKLLESANKSSHKSCGPCYLGLASIYRGLGDIEDQLENANKALRYLSDRRDEAKAHEIKGDAFLALGTEDPRKVRDAEGEFRTAAGLDGSNSILRLKLGIALLRQSRTDEGKQELNTVIKLSPNAAEAELARKFIADPRRAQEAFAPDFEVTTLDGEKLELSKLAGRIVVLDFWATWCPPCVEGVPELQKLVKKYPRDRLVLISISGDSSEEKWRAFIAKKHMEWAQYWDKDHHIRDLFAVQAFPTYLVIDREGIIRQRVVGTDPHASVAFRLDPILKALL